MTRPKQPQDQATVHQRRLAKDLAFSRAMAISALVLLIVVVIADVLYVAYVPRRGGHLMLPALVLAAPLATVLLVVVTVWNWRVMRHRRTTRPHDHDADGHHH